MIGPDRPAIDGDTDDLRTALAMLKAMSRKDLDGIQVLGRHSDPLALLFGFAELTIDALGEPATTDISAYVERLFDRLDRGSATGGGAAMAVVNERLPASAARGP